MLLMAYRTSRQYAQALVSQTLPLTEAVEAFDSAAWVVLMEIKRRHKLVGVLQGDARQV